jgi:hypothetical protein
MPRTLTTCLIAMLVLAAVPARGDAQSAMRDTPRDQTSALMTPGAHVRVKLPGEHAWTGRLVSVDGDSMFVRGASGGDTTLVRLSNVTQLDVSAGTRRSRHLVRNTVIGLGLGAGLGSLIGGGMSKGGCQKGDPCWENICFLCDYVTTTPYPPITDHAVAGTIIGGLAGGAFGLLVSRHRSHDWRPVSITRRRTGVSLTPWRGGIALACTARR